MTALEARKRPGALSVVLIAASIIGSVGISLAMDLVLILFATDPRVPSFVGAAVLLNVTCVVMSLVGAIIEWRRPGHAIGRLLLLSGPLYALLAAGWGTSGLLEPLVDPQIYRIVNWVGALVSYPGVALIVGWVPLLFPTGTLPGPRWRLPVGLLLILFVVGTVAWAVQPSYTVGGLIRTSPIGIENWPSFLQPFVDAIPFELLALIALAIAGLITRYRRGDRIERLQIRWYAAALAVCGAGFVGVMVEMAIRKGDGPLISGFVAYVGILAMPIAIGIAVTRYRLFELDRLISRTIGWALVTGVLLAVVAATVVGLQAVLAGFTQGQTLAVAASTLLAFALFQPVRRRVQSGVDRRFDRARYDGDRTAAAFAESLREQVDLAGLEGDITGTIGSALHPRFIDVWIRGAGRRGAA